MFRSKVTISQYKKGPPTTNCSSLPPPSSTFSQPLTIDSHHSPDSIFNHLRPPSLNSNYTQLSPLRHSPSHLHSSSETDDSESNNNDDNSHVQVSESNVLENIEIVDDKGHVKLTKMGMKASDVFKLAKGLRILVNVNEHGQPIRAARRVPTRYMMKLVKQPNLCPPDLNDFNDVKHAFGVELLRAVREKFYIPRHENVDNVLIALMGIKFRNNKYRIRKEIYKKTHARLREKLKAVLEASGVHGEELEHRVTFHEFREDQILAELDRIEPPPGFAYHQWLKFKSNMKSEKAKKLSEKGKKARATQSHTHITGTKSYAQVEDEHVIKYKEHPGPLTFFYLTHKRRDGSYVQSDSKEFMMAAKSEIVKRKTEGTCENTVELESSVWYDLMGDDKPGRARGYGIGVTKSSVTAFRAKLRQMQSESEKSNAHDIEMAQLKLLLSKQQQQLVAQENAMNAYMAKTNEIIGNLRDEVLLYRTAFGAGTGDVPNHLKTSSGCTQALEAGDQFQPGCSVDAFINKLT
ncbi:uncharacterized protein LOC131013609 [Salvia miltiorrhiza]|uniref:uncharacterized protein LOC131013609 n=1 Tax=Salvia miltiorrhiza TaxID=226208 RepID=UPI0025AD6C75|nr:uncharacterized protein LOC131013609 [Salvia miltiorrhiza]